MGFRPLSAYCGWLSWVFRNRRVPVTDCHGMRRIQLSCAAGSSMPPWTALQAIQLYSSFTTFTLPFSSGSIVSQLTTLPICYTPHWVSPPDKSVGDRVICTSLRNTFSYCRATDRIPNCPRAALAYAATLPGAQYNLKNLP